MQSLHQRRGYDSSNSEAMSVPVLVQVRAAQGFLQLTSTRKWWSRVEFYLSLHHYPHQVWCRHWVYHYYSSWKLPFPHDSEELFIDPFWLNLGFSALTHLVHFYLNWSKLFEFSFFSPWKLNLNLAKKKTYKIIYIVSRLCHFIF